MNSKPNIPLLYLKKSLQKTYGKDNYHSIVKDFKSNVLALYNSFIEKCKAYNLETQQKQKGEYVSSKQKQYSKDFKEIFTGVEYEEHVLDDIISELIPQKRTVNDFINSIELIGTDYEKRDFYSIALEFKSWKDFSLQDFDKKKEKKVAVKRQETERLEIDIIDKKLNIIPSIETETSVLRIDLLENIFNLFKKNKKLSITGISGIGKTFLAKHFAEHFADKFSNIVWLNCAEGLPKALTQAKGIELLESLGLAQEYRSYSENEKGLLNLVVRHLGKIRGNNLLILDNIEEKIYSHKDEIKFLSENWNILGTSQQNLIGFENFIAPNFKKEALELFYTFYTIERYDERLVYLLSAIDYHTLTIELLAKTAQERQLSIIKLINRFNEKGVNVVERAEVLVDHGIERDIISIESVEEYLNIIFDTSYLKEEQRKILLNIALMQEDSIPMDLFEEVYLNNSSEQEVIDIFIYNINALAKKGWIQIEDDKVRLHSLVKNIVIKRFSDRGGFFESIIKYLKDKLYTDPTNNILGNRKYIELAESLFGKIKEESEDLDNLKRGVASFLVHMGLFEKAKSIEGFGLKEGNFEAISKLHNLSIISSSQGNWQKSLSYSEKIFSLLGNTTVDMIYSDLMNELMLFFKVNRIENKSDFENKFTLENLICLIKIVFSASSNIILFKNEEKDFHKIIDQLHEIVSKKQNIIDVLEKNIPKKDIISVELYKNLLLDQSAYLLNIGKCYFTLTELTKTEIYYLKALSIQERALESGHILLSQTYHKLTFLYIKWENIEKAEFFLEKNTELCSKLPPNNRFLSLCKSDAESIEKLKNTINVKRNTVLWLDLLNPNLSDSEIYRRMSSLYFEHEIYESAKEYLQKEIEIYLNQPDTDFRQVLDLNIKLGICYIQLKEFDNALTIEKEIFKLCQKEYVNKREMELQLSKFRYLITANALQCNYMPMAILIISQELKILANQFFSLFSTQPSKNYLLLSTEKIFAFLFNVPDLKYPFIEKTENELDSFLKEYDSVVSNATSELTESQYREFYKTKIHYIILNGYYYTIANLCMKYENWSLAIDYHRKKLLLSQKYFDETEHIGEIHYLLSCCYYNAGDFEIALQQLYKAIDLFSKICEKNNDEEIKTYLKNAFLFEKKIKGDLENFRKFPTKRSN